MTRHAHAVDRNQAAIVSALRAVGCLVVDLSACGHGVPDLLVWAPRLRRWLLLEVKDGSLPPSKRRLTPDEEAWHLMARRAGDVYVVLHAREALSRVGAVPPALEYPARPRGPR